ncbi:MAG: hypothetical protein U9R69_09640 [Thermodesulfobacteriota bacterium]|nr:hypothetical protein [Thermodesulfobacteriota bacterium]
MKKITQYSLPGIVFLSTIVPALATAGERTDNSMMLVYLFLGVCGLIIFLQLIPVFALGFGIIKGFFGGKEKDASSHS